MKNFEVNYNGKNYWVSRSVAVVVNVYAYIDNVLCVLANKRGNGLPNNVGLWNCPSGYLDYDETVEETACREVLEETGVAIKPDYVQLMEIDSTPTRSKQNVLIRYRVMLLNEMDGGVKYKEMLTNEYSEPNEVDDIKWIPIREIDKYEWVSNKHKECIKNYSIDW